MNNRTSGQHLDASGSREVVFCHQCENEWYQDEHGLICPRCEGEITEIVSPDSESDPRPQRSASPTPSVLRNANTRDPWAPAPDSDVSDPEEADIEEHVTHGPGGSIFISQTIRSHGRPRAVRRGPGGAVGPDDLMRDFQSVLGNIMGPNLRVGQSGRSGQEDLFASPPMGIHFGGGGFPDGTGSGVVGGRFTYTGRIPARNANESQAPPDINAYVPNILQPISGQRSSGHLMVTINIITAPDQILSLLRNVFGNMGPLGAAGDNEGRGGMPPGLQGLFASLLNPANARAGDAVYSQEALDQIISQLMEQHPTSNAPGPAAPDAIASLPKKKLDEQLLGPEGKGECSVCMDDVHIGDEVVMLPCNHWFHETCAAAWLGEHNTCPICRKGIEGVAQPANAPSSSRRSSQLGNPWSRTERPPRRLSLGSRLNRENTGSRNESRLDAIRSAGRLSPTEEGGPRRWQVVGTDFAGPMPGGFPSPRRQDSDMNVESQRNVGGGQTSSGERSRHSRRSSSSVSNSAGGSSSHSGNGPMAWLRDRFSGSSDRERRD